MLRLNAFFVVFAGNRSRAKNMVVASNAGNNFVAGNIAGNRSRAKVRGRIEMLPAIYKKRVKVNIYTHGVDVPFYPPIPI